jgi:hypothetical protein
MAEHIEITGGAGPEITAAIAAVVSSIEDEERLAAATRPEPIHQSQWIRSGQSAKHLAPRKPKDGGSTTPNSMRSAPSEI